MTANHPADKNGPVARVDDYPSESGNADHRVTAPAEDTGAHTSFFSWENLKVAQVNIIAGTLNGYSIGFVGVYAELYSLSTNCAKYGAKTSCETLSNAKCQWFPGGASGDYCGWKGTVTCNQVYTTEALCLADSECNWNYSDKECQNPFGYTAAYNGIFAGAMIVGCMIGSFFAGPLAKKVGPRISFLIVGIVGVICSVLYHVSAATDEFWVLAVGRLVIGLVLGLVCVAAPMYVAENAAPKYCKMIGVLFQVFTTFGIFLAGTMGLALGQSIRFDNDSDQNLMGRMQGLCVFSTLLSLLVIMLGVLLGSSNGSSSVDGEEKDDTVAVTDEKQYSWGQMIGPILVGFVVAGTLQLTGINAVMNYAPTIMGNLGLAPLVGNFIVMLWNFVTTIVSIPLASVFSMRQLFLANSLITSLCCLFLCGIPVYPGVTSTDSAKNGVAITGILIFIASFEFGVGPCFYVLAQDLFPPSFRPKGSSSTMVAQFVFNVIINVCYPIATEKISGGPSGNQDKGQSIAFIFFGCCGLVCFVVQIFFLYPWEEPTEASTSTEPTENDSHSLKPEEVKVGVTRDAA